METFSPKLDNRIEIWNFEENVPSFIFRGHHSTFNLYPNSGDLRIEIKAMTIYMFDVRIKCIIFDNEVIHNIPIINISNAKVHAIYSIENLGKRIVFNIIFN